MNPEMFVPIYGTMIMLEETDDPEMPFADKVAIAAGAGASSVVPMIAMGETIGFTQLQVRSMQALVAAASNPLTYVAGAVLVIATSHELAKKELQKKPGYSANRMKYTTPFSSGFGTVV